MNFSGDFGGYSKIRINLFSTSSVWSTQKTNVDQRIRLKKCYKKCEVRENHKEWSEKNLLSPTCSCFTISFTFMPKEIKIYPKKIPWSDGNKTTRVKNRHEKNSKKRLILRENKRNIKDTRILTISKTGSYSHCIVEHLGHRILSLYLISLIQQLRTKGKERKFFFTKRQKKNSGKSI